MRRFVIGSALAASLALAGCAADESAAPADDAAAAASYGPGTTSAEEPVSPSAPPRAEVGLREGGDILDPSDIRRIPQPIDGADPISLTIPGIGNVPIVPVGVAADGQAEIPEDVSRVGWYEYGSAPGERDGSVVIMGHRDSRGGKGALFTLPSVTVGAAIDVVDADGVTHRYKVVRNESISKQVVPLADLFQRDGPKQLTIISCGGAYVPDQGGYLDNVVVTAVPV